MECSNCLKLNQTIKNLQSSNQNLIAGHDRLNKVNCQLKDQAKIKDKSLKDLQKENKSLTSRIENYINETESTQARNDLLAQELTKSKDRVKDLIRENSLLSQNLTKLENNYQNLEENRKKLWQEFKESENHQCPGNNISLK